MRINVGEGERVYIYRVREGIREGIRERIREWIKRRGMRGEELIED